MLNYDERGILSPQLHQYLRLFVVARIWRGMRWLVEACRWLLPLHADDATLPQILHQGRGSTTSCLT